MADTDTAEWILLDTDLTTRLAILPVLSSHLYLEWQEPGSGSLEIPLDTTAAGLITNGQFCQCWYRGAARGGFFIDNIKIADAGQGEYSGRVLSVSGRGPMALLDEAIVWQDGSGATERQYTDKSKAYILIDQITEAKARGGLSALTYDFTSTDDSTGTLWTDSEDLKFPVGTTLLDMVRQFGKTGDMEFSVSLSSTDIVLSAYKNGVGSDKTNTIFFRIGMNCQEAGSDERGDEIRNVYLTKYKDGFTTVSSSDSIATRRRREKFLSLEVAQSPSSANVYASAKLDLDKDPHKSINVQVYDGIGPRLFLDYTLGDTVTLDKFGTEVTFRILGIQADFNGSDFASVVLEMNWIARDDNDLDWLMKQWVTAHDSDLTETKIWLGFGQPSDPVNTMIIYGNYLYIGGQFTSIVGKTAANYVARYDLVNGTWYGMGTGCTDTVVALCEFAGDIYAATADNVSRWSSSDEAFITVGSGTSASINCMTKIADDSLLLVGGTFNTWEATPLASAVMAWDGGTWYWVALASLNGVFTCNALANYNGEIYGGFIQPSSSDPIDVVFRKYDGPTWSAPLATPLSSTGNSIASMQTIGASLFYTDGEGLLYSWDGSSTDTASVVGTVSPGVATPNTALTEYLSTAYLGGAFTSINGTTDTFNRIASYGGGVWGKLGGGLTGGTCKTIVVNDSNVFAGGAFTAADGKSYPYLAVWITNFQNLVDQLAKNGTYDLGAGIHGATATTTLTDNDEFPLWEDTSQALRKVTYAYVKSNLETFLDTVYLRLDAAGGSVTGPVNITPGTPGDGGIYIETHGDAYPIDAEQYTVNDDITSGNTVFLYRETSGTGNIAAAMLEGWQAATGSGTITGPLIHFQTAGLGGTNLFSVLADGSVRLPQISDTDAANDCMYYSTTQSKVSYKDSGGSVHPLY